MLKSVARKPVVRHLIETFKLSERVACSLAGVSRTAFRYQHKDKCYVSVRTRLIQLASQYPRYGYLMLHGLQKGEELVVNRKRICRLYTEEASQVRTKKRKKLTRPRLPMEVLIATKEGRLMDFASVQLSKGRRFRVLYVVDDYSREMVGQLVPVSISDRQVSRFLSQLIEQRTKPKKVICENGTEFTSQAMFFRSKESGVQLGVFNLAKPLKIRFCIALMANSETNV